MPHLNPMVSFMNHIHVISFSCKHQNLINKLTIQLIILFRTISDILLFVAMAV